MSLPASAAYLLVSHGSRDPRHQAAMNRLAQLVRKQLSQRGPSPIIPGVSEKNAGPGAASQHPQSSSASLAQARPGTWLPGLLLTPMVGTATLENGPLPLHQQIYEFYVRARAAGVKRLILVPLFLLSGVHVMEDIPAEVAMAQTLLSGSADIQVCGHLGCHPHLQDLLQKKVEAAASEAWLLLSHGSRRPGGNRAVVTLAKNLGGTVAFWSVPPDLEHQVITLMQGGYQRLAILPYFLFAGGITDAITRRTEDLAERFPQIKFRLLPPLGATPEVAKLVCDLAKGDRRLQGSSRLPLPMPRAALRHYPLSVISQ